MSRDKHEASIRWLDTYSGREWERALNTVLLRHPGLSFYTDEQIKEIRTQMVKDAWFSHRLNRENRKRFAESNHDKARAIAAARRVHDCAGA